MRHDICGRDREGEGPFCRMQSTKPPRVDAPAAVATALAGTGQALPGLVRRIGFVAHLLAPIR